MAGASRLLLTHVPAGGLSPLSPYIAAVHPTLKMPVGALCS